MRAVSQVIVAILLVGVAVVAGTMLSYIVTNSVALYKPSNVMVARVGEISVELSDINSGFYSFEVTTRLVNLGSQPLVLSSGSIVVLVKGSTGRSRIISCNVQNQIVLNPGEIKDFTAFCDISRSTLNELFGTQSPRADTVKSSMVFLYLSTYVSTINTGGGSTGGSGGGGSSGGGSSGGGGSGGGGEGGLPPTRFILPL